MIFQKTWIIFHPDHKDGAGIFSTAEPVFRTLSLAPGNSKDFIMNLKW